MKIGRSNIAENHSTPTPHPDPPPQGGREKDAFDFGGEIVWRPTPELIAQSNLKRFIDRHGIACFNELLRKSTDDIAWFWDTILRDELKIHFATPYSSVVDLSNGIQRPRWCVGGEMNIVTSLLDRYENTPTNDKIALRAESEDGKVRTLTYDQLRREVNKCANALRDQGIGPGDRVGVFMPMTAECVIAMLAIIKIGAIFLPLFSGYGASAVATRLIDAGAKALFTTDVCWRRGKVSSIKTIAHDAAAQVPTLKHMIILRRDRSQPCPRMVGRDHWWDELVDRQPDRAGTARTGADDPMMLIYTSGTTGKPKGAVHTHCGFPIKAAQDMLHGMDLHADETIWWMTDMGWMMGPWLVFGTLLCGATMLVYDGAPDFPGPDRVWDIVERHRVTMLGLSPTFVRAILPHGETPVRRHDLSSLRKFASTGEPWNPDPWLWLFTVVGEAKRPILNYSGGTEISGGIVCCNVLTPQRPCSFAGPLPGMAVDVVDENGSSVRGQVGELVIRKPWLGMTRGFWKDESDRRYLDTYWSRFKDTWVHGDFAAVDDDGLWYILGRSDDTIKVAGKRLGPAEVESILVAHPDVKEAAAIGVPDEVKGQAVVCFCVLKDDSVPRDELRDELKKTLSRELGKALLPKEIRFVPDLPKTRNAKVMRRVIRAAYLGQNLGDVSSLENPAAINEIRKSADV
jgi:acetyl-CoA synthetase